MLIKKSGKIAQNIVFFDESRNLPPPRKVDVILENSCSKKRLFSNTLYTYLIDLTKNTDEIFSGFTQNSRNEIRRAGEYNAIIETLNVEIEKERFFNFYNDFAKIKNLMPIESNDMVDLLIKNGLFIIRAASIKGERLFIILTFHK